MWRPETIATQELYPGYPPLHQRLHASDIFYDEERGLVFPTGPWDTSPNELPTLSEQKQYLSCGLSLDSEGRPLHPWLADMLPYGVVTGKGFYWHWGPNYTADPIVVRYDLGAPHILLITRKDTGAWALPGGFIDPGETAVQAALRETREEALLDLTPLATPSAIYCGPVADARSTVHAWAETHAYRFDLPLEFSRQLSALPYEAGDDAGIAAWHPLTSLPPAMHGSHRQLIRLSGC